MTFDSSKNKLPIQFGPYNLFDYIGKGGMAEIFLAQTLTELGTDKICVIKRILPHLNEDKDFCEMLINEAKICSNLNHANIVQTVQLGQIESQYYIAMEYVEGVDLNKLLGTLSQKGQSLPLPFALYIITETLKALDFAHRNPTAPTPTPIIHRDVSPTNVLISTEGEVKLCDFGIAKVAQEEIESDEHHINEQHLKGKMAYMAPEHITGGIVDSRSDLYTAGILLWELLNGRRLFKSKKQDETYEKAKAGVVPELTNKDFKEYEMLNAIVKKALAKDPNSRFQNGQEFVRAIEDYLHVTGQIVSQLRFLDFLNEHLKDHFIDARTTREHNLEELNFLNSAPEPKDIPKTSTFTASLLPDDDQEPSQGDIPIISSTKEGSIMESLEEKFKDEENQEERLEAKSTPTPSSGWKWIIVFIIIALAAILAYVGYDYFTQ